MNIVLRSAARQRFEPAEEVGRQVEGEPFASAGTHGRAGMVGRQVQRRRAGQLLGPVGERLGVVAALGLADVVEVAELERRQGRGLARRVRRVELGQLGEQYFERPAVAGDVVQHEAEHVVVGGEPDEGEPQHRAVFEVERAVGALGRRAPGRVPGPAGRTGRFVRVAGPRAPIVWTGRPSRSAKVLRSMSCRSVSSASTRSRSSTSRGPWMRSVTGRWYETSAGLSRCRNQSRSWAEQSAAERAGSGGAARAAAAVSRPGAGGRAVPGAAPGDERGRPGDGRVVEEAAERHVGAQFGAHPGDDPRGQQGVAAKFEQAGQRVDRVDAQHLAPDAQDGGGQLARRGALRQLGIHRFTRPTSGPADR